MSGVHDALLEDRDELVKRLEDLLVTCSDEETHGVIKRTIDFLENRIY